MQDNKEEMMRRYKFKQSLEKLRSNQRENEEKMNHPFQSIGNGISNAYKTINGINKANELYNNWKNPMPSQEFMGKVGAELPQGMNFSTPADSMSGLGNTSLNTQAMPTNTIGSAAEGASKATGALGNASSALGNAAPVVGTATGLYNAGKSFANGDYTNGAMDLASTGAMFIPGVGWAVAGAIKIGQMIKNMFDKKSQEAMQKSQQEAAKSQKASAEAFAEKQQEFDEVKQENAQKMQQQMQNMNQPQDNSQVIADLMNKFKTTQEQPMYQQVPQQEQTVEQPTQQDNSALVQDILGQVTGGASNVQQPTQPQYDFNDANFQAPETNNFSNQIEYNDTPEALTGSVSKGYAGELPELTQGTPEANKQSIMQKLGSFAGDFSQGYDDNLTNGFRKGDLYNMIQAKQQATASTPMEEGVATGDATPVQQKKSIANRLGEAAGTGARVMANPWTQAAIAGAISRASGGDWDDVAKAAYQYGTSKAKSDYYQNLLAPNSRPSVLGNYDSKDYNAQTLNNYRTTMSDINRDKIRAQLDQNFPLASDYYASQLASGQMSIDDYNKVVSNPNYNPNQRISLNTIKTTTDSKYKQDTIDARNRQINNNYQLGKERNSISATNAANNNANRQTSNQIQRDRLNWQQQEAEKKAIAKKQAEQEEKLQTGQYVLGTTPNGKQVLIPRSEVKNFRKNGGRV